MDGKLTKQVILRSNAASRVEVSRRLLASAIALEEVYSLAREYRAGRVDDVEIGVAFVSVVLRRVWPALVDIVGDAAKLTPPVDPSAVVIADKSRRLVDLALGGDVDGKGGES